MARSGEFIPASTAFRFGELKRTVFAGIGPSKLCRQATLCIPVCLARATSCRITCYPLLLATPYCPSHLLTSLLLPCRYCCQSLSHLRYAGRSRRPVRAPGNTRNRMRHSQEARECTIASRRPVGAIFPPIDEQLHAERAESRALDTPARRRHRVQVRLTRSRQNGEAGSERVASSSPYDFPTPSYSLFLRTLPFPTNPTSK